MTRKEAIELLTRSRFSTLFDLSSLETGMLISMAEVVSEFRESSKLVGSPNPMSEREGPTRHRVAITIIGVVNHNGPDMNAVNRERRLKLMLMRALDDGFIEGGEIEIKVEWGGPYLG